MHLIKESGLEFLSNSLQYCYVVTDANWRIISSNRLFTDTYKKTLTANSRKDFLSLIGCEDVDRLNIAETLRHESCNPVTIETRRRDSCGKTRWLKWEIEATELFGSEPHYYRITGHDITAHKEKGHDLWGQANLMDSISDAVITSDTDFVILGWNKAAEVIYGIRAEDALGCNLAVLNYKYPGESVVSARNNLMETGAWTGEIIYQRSDGKRLFLHASVTAIKDHTQQVVGYIAINRDITAAKEKEQLLQQQAESERMLWKTKVEFSSFMENTPAIAWIVDEQGFFTYVNPPFNHAFGLSESVIGRNIRDLFEPEFVGRFLSCNKRVLEENKPLETIEESKLSDGSVAFYRIYRFPIKSFGAEKLIGGKAFDMSPQIQTQLELAKSNERYRLSGKASSDAIWDWQIHDNTLYRSDAFTTLFGYPNTRPSEGLHLEFVHPEDYVKVRESLERELNSAAEFWKMEYRYKCATGEYKIISDKAYILRDANKKAYRLIGAMQDITEQRSLEKRLVSEESQKKQEIIQAILTAQEQERKDIANELHDNVNQILSTCSLYLEVAQQEEDPASYIAQAYSNTKLAIEEIRKISHTLNPAALQDIGLITAIKSLVDQINSSKKLIVHLRINRIKESIIHSDVKLSLFRIVQEQMNNILKHAEAENVFIRLTSRAKKIHLDISDDGKGFDAVSIKKGLGLNNIISRSEYYGGTAVLTSEPAKGCDLSVTIPIT